VDIVAVPWTHLLEMRWRPALEFYEERTAILRCLDNEKLLGAFRVQANQIDARLTKRGHALRVRQSGLILELLGQDADLELGWNCVVTALQKIKPKSVHVHSRYQHLEPLDGPFDATVRAARERFLLVPDGEEIVDWAMIVNLPGQATAEFGIIRDDEAIDRLTRDAGSMGESEGVQNGAGFWRSAAFPEVGLFIDSDWPEIRVGDEPQEARDAWGTQLRRATEFADNVYAKLTVAV
jgi:hypothetical protein